MNLTPFPRGLPEEAAATLATVLDRTDAEVLIRVAKVSAQGLHRCAEVLPRRLTGVVIDPATSPLEVAEAAAGLQDRVEIWSEEVTELGLMPGAMLPGGLTPWTIGG